MDPTGASRWVTQRKELLSKDIKAVAKDNGHQWTAQPVPSAPESRGEHYSHRPHSRRSDHSCPGRGHHLETSLLEVSASCFDVEAHPKAVPPPCMDPGTKVVDPPHLHRNHSVTRQEGNDDHSRRLGQ